MKAENLGKLSLGVSVLPLTLFIIRHLKIGMEAPWLLLDFCGIRAVDYWGLCICNLAGENKKHVQPLLKRH